MAPVTRSAIVGSGRNVKNQAAVPSALATQFLSLLDDARIRRTPSEAWPCLNVVHDEMHPQSSGWCKRRRLQNASGHGRNLERIAAGDGAALRHGLQTA